MSSSYFDRNQNLQIHGDVNFISSSGSSQDDHSFFHVSQRLQAISPQSRKIEQGFKILCDNTAPLARYGHGHSFTRPRCHPGTRIAVQEHIFRWFDDQDGPIAMWMNGPVGIGKSAIAQTVTYLAAKRGHLSSAFFFFRSDDTRNSAKHLVATLAYEMTQRMPHTLDPVCRTIASNPHIFSSPLDRQINDVLLRSLHVPSGSPSGGGRLIVIDGLDECLDVNAQQAIISSFILSFLSLPTQAIPHKLLIVSRPESHISSAFSATDIRSHIRHLSLQSWDTEDDIAIFLCSKLDEVKATHPLRHHLPSIWPDEDSFRQLRRRSVGSFAYASSVIRFLASPQHHPERALQDVLSLHPHRISTAFADLDAFYRHILSGLNPDIYLTVQKLLCLHLYSRNGSLARIAVGLADEQSNLELVLIHVASLIRVDAGHINFHHSSFEEFLRDKERSGDHHAFSPKVTNAVATALSNIWLQPISHDSSFWLEIVGSGLSGNSFNVDTDLCILRTLAATKLPASIIAHQDDFKSTVINCVTDFFVAIQSKFIKSSDPTHRPVYNEAFNVVCAWLRSHFDVHSRDTATLSDVLKTIVNITTRPMIIQEDLWLYSFGYLARKDSEPIDFLCRLFPEMDCVEVCSRIVENYLSFEIWRRVSYESESFGSSASPVSLSELYVLALGHQDAMVPNFCQRLEQQLVVEHNDLSGTLSQYKASKLYILRILYGPTCNMDSRRGVPYFVFEREGQKTLNHYVHQPLWKELVEETDNYIRQVHAKFDFPYMLQDVEALYRLEPVDF